MVEKDPFALDKPSVEDLPVIKSEKTITKEEVNKKQILESKKEINKKVLKKPNKIEKAIKKEINKLVSKEKVKQFPERLMNPKEYLEKKNNKIEKLQKELFEKHCSFKPIIGKSPNYLNKM